jgi:hypothetical protein
VGIQISGEFESFETKWRAQVLADLVAHQAFGCTGQYEPEVIVVVPLENV